MEQGHGVLAGRSNPGVRPGDGAEHGFAVDENPTREGVLAISVSDSSRLL